MRPAFALWLTGPPAAGKSSIARCLLHELQRRGIDPAVLESDVLRGLLTPRPRYDEAERDLFYAALAHLGGFLVERGIPVLFDATANRRAYRDRARQHIGRFAEVFVSCPPQVCAARDPKGLYRMAREGKAPNLPGARIEYEPPVRAELEVRGDEAGPEESAREILAWLEERHWI